MSGGNEEYKKCDGAITEKRGGEEITRIERDGKERAVEPVAPAVC